MKKQVLFVHGGGEGAYEKAKKLAENLRDVLGAAYDVRCPKMPDEDSPEDEAAFEGLIESLDAMRMTRRSPRLAEVAATAAFLTSDTAGAITGTFVNATSGMFPS